MSPIPEDTRTMAAAAAIVTKRIAAASGASQRLSCRCRRDRETRLRAGYGLYTNSGPASCTTGGAASQRPADTPRAHDAGIRVGARIVSIPGSEQRPGGVVPGRTEPPTRLFTVDRGESGVYVRVRDAAMRRPTVRQIHRRPAECFKTGGNGRRAGGSACSWRSSPARCAPPSTDRAKYVFGMRPRRSKLPLG
jgi:hypothetical protein